MREVSNIEELTIAVIDEFAEKFSTDFAPYSYSLTENRGIHILNPDNIVVLEIYSGTVTIKDIIQDAIDEVLYKEQKNIASSLAEPILKAIATGVDGETLTYLTNQLEYIEKPEPNFKTYKYFNTEEQWFQQSTVHADVLPFETSLQLNKIKQAILNDLTKQWIM